MCRGRDPVGHLLPGWDREPRAHLAEPILGPADPLRHRGFRHQERPGDLCRAQAADGTQRQRHLRGPRKRRVTAEQQQGQRVVPSTLAPRCRPPAPPSRVGLAPGDRLLPAGPGLIAAPLIHQAARGHRDQPGFRVVRHTLARPLPSRSKQRLLHCVLGSFEVAVPRTSAASTSGAQCRQTCSRPASVTDRRRPATSPVGVR